MRRKHKKMAIDIAENRAFADGCMISATELE